MNPEPPRILSLKATDSRDLSFLAWALFAFVASIPLFQFLRESHDRDFIYFYAIGYLLNHYPADRLYDYGLQKNIIEALQHEPLKVGHWGLFAYPPHLAMLFQPFALLPQWTACRIWLALNLAMYLTGLRLLVRRFCGGDAWQRSLFFWFGLFFWPFLSWMLIAGQISAIGFLAMAMAIYWEDRQRYLWSGLALSVCTYKPTLLLLVLPMLLVLRRPKTLAGFGAGSCLWAAVAALLAGPYIWLSWLQASAGYASGVSRVIPPTLDLRTFTAAITGATRWGSLLFAATAGAAAAFLVRIWWQARQTPPFLSIASIWAITVTWTLLLNLYVPVYDSVQVVASILVTAAMLVKYSPRWFFGLCGWLLVVAVVSTWLSDRIGWQLLTLVVAAIGILQMRAALNQNGAARRLL